MATRNYKPEKIVSKHSTTDSSRQGWAAQVVMLEACLRHDAGHMNHR